MFKFTRAKKEPVATQACRSVAKLALQKNK